MPLKPTCRGCVYLKYKGPFGVLPDDEVKEADGNYRCQLFQEPLCRADKTPLPIFRTCKETR